MNVLQESGQKYNLTWSTRIRDTSARVKLTVLVGDIQIWEDDVTSRNVWEVKQANFTATSSTLQLKFTNTKVYSTSPETVFVDDILLQRVRRSPSTAQHLH